MKIKLGSVKLIPTVLFFSCLTNYANSQVDPVGNFNRHIAANWSGEYVRIGPYNVKGSPYLFGEAFPGGISYRSGKAVPVTNVLYDIYHQKAGISVGKEMNEIEDIVDDFSILLPERLGGKKLLFRNSYLFNKPEIKSFFNVLEDGSRFSFLKLYKSKLVTDPVNNMDTKAKVFEQYFEYYVFNKKTKSLDKIKLVKKEIQKFLNDEIFLSNYSSQNHIDFSNEDEVVRLIRNFNEQN